MSKTKYSEINTQKPLTIKDRLAIKAQTKAGGKLVKFEHFKDVINSPLNLTITEQKLAYIKYFEGIFDNARRMCGERELSLQYIRQQFLQQPDEKTKEVLHDICKRVEAIAYPNHGISVKGEAKGNLVELNERLFGYIKELYLVECTDLDTVRLFYKQAEESCGKLQLDIKNNSKILTYIKPFLGDENGILDERSIIGKTKIGEYVGYPNQNNTNAYINRTYLAYMIKYYTILAYANVLLATAEQQEIVRKKSNANSGINSEIDSVDYDMDNSLARVNENLTKSYNILNHFINDLHTNYHPIPEELTFENIMNTFIVPRFGSDFQQAIIAGLESQRLSLYRMQQISQNCSVDDSEDYLKKMLVSLNKYGANIADLATINDFYLTQIEKLAKIFKKKFGNTIYHIEKIIRNKFSDDQDFTKEINEFLKQFPDDANIEKVLAAAKADKTKESDYEPKEKNKQILHERLIADFKKDSNILYALPFIFPCTKKTQNIESKEDVSPEPVIYNDFTAEAPVLAIAVHDNDPNKVPLPGNKLTLVSELRRQAIAYKDSAATICNTFKATLQQKQQLIKQEKKAIEQQNIAAAKSKELAATIPELPQEPEIDPLMAIILRLEAKKIESDTIELLGPRLYSENTELTECENLYLAAMRLFAAKQYNKAYKALERIYISAKDDKENKVDAFTAAKVLNCGAEILSIYIRQELQSNHEDALKLKRIELTMHEMACHQLNIYIADNAHNSDLNEERQKAINFKNNILEPARIEVETAVRSMEDAKKSSNNSLYVNLVQNNIPMRHKRLLPVKPWQGIEESTRQDSVATGTLDPVNNEVKISDVVPSERPANTDNKPSKESLLTNVVLPPSFSSLLDFPSLVGATGPASSAASNRGTAPNIARTSSPLQPSPTEQPKPQQAEFEQKEDKQVANKNTMTPSQLIIDARIRATNSLIETLNSNDNFKLALKNIRVEMDHDDLGCLRFVFSESVFEDIIKIYQKDEDIAKAKHKCFRELKNLISGSFGSSSLVDDKIAIISPKASEEDRNLFIDEMIKQHKILLRYDCDKVAPTYSRSIPHANNAIVLTTPHLALKILENKLTLLDSSHQVALQERGVNSR